LVLGFRAQGFQSPISDFQKGFLQSSIFVKIVSKIAKFASKSLNFSSTIAKNCEKKVFGGIAVSDNVRPVSAINPNWTPDQPGVEQTTQL
jgi:hypothetical protein